MGKRRIRCLKRLGFSDIHGYDPRKDRCKEVTKKYSVSTVSNWDSAKKIAVDTWIISAPPDHHMNYAFQAVDLGKHFFTEANIPDESMNNLIDALAHTDIIGVPSCTMRYYEGVKKIKELVNGGAIGKPLFFVYHWGQHLSTWHEYENYQDFYVSKRETGACREIVPFELVWLEDIFGNIETISCMKGKLSNLDADIDDIYQLQMKFDTGIMGSLIVEVFSQPAVNVIRVVGTEGSMFFDQHANTFKLYKTKDQKWIKVVLDRGIVEEGYLYAEEPYIEEMKDFIEEILGEGKYQYTFSDDLKILELLKNAEISAEKGLHFQRIQNNKLTSIKG